MFQSWKQLFLFATTSSGKVWGPGLDRRVQTEILVNALLPSEYRGAEYAYALVVVRVVSRYAWA